MNSDSPQSKQAPTPELEPPATPPAGPLKVFVDIFHIFLGTIIWLLVMLGYCLRGIIGLLMMLVFFPCLAIGLGVLIGEKIGGAEGVYIGAIIGGYMMLHILIFCALFWLFCDSGIVEYVRKRWIKEDH